MDTKEFAEKFIKAEEEAWKGNVKALEEIDDPNVVFHLPPMPDIVGVEGHKKYILTGRQGASDIRFEFLDFVGENNMIALRFTERYKHTGALPFPPVPPTGKEISFSGAMIFHLKNGKIIEGWMYADVLGLLQQLGFEMSPAK